MPPPPRAPNMFVKTIAPPNDVGKKMMALQKSPPPLQ